MHYAVLLCLAVNLSQDAISTDSISKSSSLRAPRLRLPTETEKIKTPSSAAAAAVAAAASMLFWKKSSAGSSQRASAWRRLVRSLKQNASDVDVFNKVSLRAAGREEAWLTNSDMENNEAGLIIVITIIMFSV